MDGNCQVGDVIKSAQLERGCHINPGTEWLVIKAENRQEKYIAGGTSHSVMGWDVTVHALDKNGEYNSSALQMFFRQGCRSIINQVIQPAEITLVRRMSRQVAWTLQP